MGVGEYGRVDVSAFAKSFRDLKVYQSSLALAAEVHAFCKLLPAHERYAMSDQVRRASRSVCQNIAEAWRKRRYKAAFVAKLSDAEAEAGEVQSCLDLCLAFDYLKRPEYEAWNARYEQVIAQLITMSNQADRWCR